MLKVLFVTGAHHEPYMVNFNHYQRVYFLSRQAELTVYGKRGSSFSVSANEGTKIVNAPFKDKLGMIISCLLWLSVERRSERFDIVLTEPSKLCICGLFAKFLFGAKWVVDVWDIPFRCRSKRLWRKCICRIDRRLARYLFKFADLFILSILPDLEFKEFRVPREKMLLLKNAIWLDRLSSDLKRDGYSRDGTFDILCMRSRFSQDGGLDVLAKAFEIIDKSCDGLELNIVGKIPKVIWHQVEPLRRHNNVHFWDFVEHDELLQMIAVSAACVVPFRKTPDLSQTFPIKVLEYLSLGAVVVAADLPGTASMIKHGENGLLFQPGNAMDLAEKLRMVYEKRELSEAISSKARALDGEYDCRKKAEVILNTLTKLAG